MDLQRLVPQASSFSAPRGVVSGWGVRHLQAYLIRSRLNTQHAFKSLLEGSNGTKLKLGNSLYCSHTLPQFCTKHSSQASFVASLTGPVIPQDMWGIAFSPLQKLHHLRPSFQVLPGAHPPGCLSPVVYIESPSNLAEPALLPIIIGLALAAAEKAPQPSPSSPAPDCCSLPPCTLTGS